MSNCLLCSSPEVTPTSSSGDNSTSTLEFGTEVIFLLRQLLHLPATSCEELLISHGHPGDWIDLCSPCSSLVTQARDLYLQITRLQCEFQAIQTTLRLQLGVRRKPFLQGNDDKATDKILTFLPEIQGSAIQVPNVVDKEISGNNDMITVPYPWITPIQSREDPRQLKSITGRKIMNIVNTLNLTKIQAGQGMKQETRIITRNYSKKIAKIKKSSKRRRKVGGKVGRPRKKVPAEETLSTWPGDPVNIGMELDNGLMGEEIIPEPSSAFSQQFEEEAEVQIQVLKEEDEDIADADPLGSYPNSSGSEYCVSEDEEASSGDDIYVSNGRGLGTRLKGGGIEDADFTQKSEVQEKVGSTPISKTAVRPITKLELIQYDVEIPAQSSWVWDDFVQWRKSRILEFHREHPRSAFVSRIEAEKEFAKFVPTLKWLAKKYEIKSFPCSGCGDVLRTMSSLQTHSSKCEEISLYRCWYEGCSAKFAINKSLEKHIRCHLAPEDLTCLGCNLYFRKLKDFSAHVVKSQESSICREKALHCTKCRDWDYKTYFSSQSVLNVHIRIRHIPAEELPFVCTIVGCGRRFSRPSFLLKHKKSHHNPDPVEVAPVLMCDQCGGTFSSQIRLVSHVRHVHRARLPGAKRFPCPICGKEMITKAKLKRHKQIHIPPEDAPHLCTLCGKRFRLREYLNIHMRSHDPERHLKYPHYMPKKKKEPGAPEKRGVAGAKIGRPPVERLPQV